jgi:hypothetical protein
MMTGAPRRLIGSDGRAAARHPLHDPALAARAAGARERGVDGSVEVVLPRRASERAARDAVRELAAWIERRRRALARAAAEVAGPRAPCPSWASR